MLRRFLMNESGSTSPEWAFLVTILVLGAITGIIASRPLDVQDPEPQPVAQAKR